MEFARHSLFFVNSCLLEISHFSSNYIAKTARILLVHRVWLPDWRFLEPTLATILEIKVSASFLSSALFLTLQGASKVTGWVFHTHIYK